MDMESGLEELYKFFEAISNGADLILDSVGTDEVGPYVIDTCKTLDCGYETAIKKSDGANTWVVVQRYKNKELAEKGHKIWLGMCAANPISVYSVQFKEYIYL